MTFYGDFDGPYTRAMRRWDRALEWALVVVMLGGLPLIALAIAIGLLLRAL